MRSEVVVADFLHGLLKLRVRCAVGQPAGSLVVSLHDVGDVVGFYGLAFVVRAESVGLHVVKPHLVGAAAVGAGEEQYGGAHPGVGFEHAAGHGNDGLEFLAFDEFAADLEVGFAAAKKHRRAR